MAGDDTLRAIGRLIDGLYEGKDELGREEIYRGVAAQDASPEVMTYFSHLPDGDYTMDELVDEIGGELGEAGDVGDLDLLT